jgi:hypothetical protein
MNNYLFNDIFFIVAHNLLYFRESRNNKKWPNKNNDVITDLGGGGNFPMFRCAPRIFSALPDYSRAPFALAFRGSVTAPAVKSWVSP